MDRNFSDLVDAFGEQLYGFCLRLAYSKEDAEDLLQEAFLKAMEQMPKIIASDDPKGFLFSTAVYIWKSKRRKYARRARIAPAGPLNEEILGDFGPEEEVLARETADTLRGLVNELPDRLKIPVIMRYTAEMELAQIAQALNIPVGTVKSRLHKARKIIEKGMVNQL
ncbi:MAG: RNA polymerase sigma factor [Clostridiales bacterium]|jgi:RNA polymerase sigma-70 factor (ECF subfamily)|nr:RNA polymerase sigma factor [Clostridiales bacterium]